MPQVGGVPRSLVSCALGDEGADAAVAATATNATALLWLQASLRVADNALLLRAAAVGSKGLQVAVVWRHGRKVPTPAASFMAHAVRALRGSLAALGGCLVVLHADDESEASC